ncbi:MAG: endonuclease NucS [Solirubrobacteraceae bacterium]
MRLIVARCQVSYVGRTTTVLSEAVRLLMCKGDGTFMVWADGGSPNVKPLNWMTPPTVWEEEHDENGKLERLIVRTLKGTGKHAADERLEIELAEVLTDVEHELDVLAPLEKEGLEREMQELLAAAPHWCGEGFRLIRREWPTDVGPVDLMCRDEQDEWVAVEIKRVATMDSVRQLEGYLERIRLDPAMAACRGVLVAKWIKPQARVMAEARGIACVEVDVEVLRGNREPELRLFAA